MKRFVIIEVPRGVFIIDTNVKPRPQRHIFYADADTHEEAVILRDKRRLEREDEKSKADERWKKAEDKVDLDTLNQLAGIR